MIRRRKAVYVVAALLAALCPLTRAADPNESAVPLSFEVSSTTLGPLSSESASRYFGSQRPGYAAVVPIRGPSREYLPLPTSSNMARWFAREFVRSYPGFSGQQQKLLHLESVVKLFAENNALLYYNLQGDPNKPAVLLFAMTQEDAKTMARAYAEFAMLAFRTNLGFAVQDKEKATKEIADLKKKIPEVEQSLKKSQDSLEALGKVVPYRTEQEAVEAMGELNRVRNATQVEIAGIRAKIAAIQKYQHELPSEQGTRLSLMFIEESIALQAAEARKKMATDLRNEASRFVDLKQTVQSATTEKDTLSTRLPQVERELQEARSRQDHISQIKPQVGGAVTIYPVQWTAGPSER